MKFVLFVLYNACNTYEVRTFKLDQFNLAKKYLSAILIIHFVQFYVLIFGGSTLLQLNQLSTIQYLILLFGLSIFAGLVDFLVSRKTLVNALKIYANHRIKKYSKLVVFFYFLLNCFLVFLLVWLRR
jgi:hypothetical protein